MRHGDLGHLSSCLGSALVLGFKGLFDTWCIKIIEKNVKKDLMFRYGCSNARERNEKQIVIIITHINCHENKQEENKWQVNNMIYV